jgi:hypothetical protein
MAKGHGGPAKGTGSTKPRHANFKPGAEAKAANAASQTVKQKLRAWREAHPDWEARPAGPSKKEIRDYIASAIPDVIDKAVQIALDDRAPKQFEAVNALMQQHLGRPSQAVDLTTHNVLDALTPDELREWLAICRNLAKRDGDEDRGAAIPA